MYRKMEYVFQRTEQIDKNYGPMTSVSHRRQHPGTLSLAQLLLKIYLP
jgi:hypothetical protein